MASQQPARGQNADDIVVPPFAFALSALLCLYRGSMVDVEYWHVDVFSRYAFQGNGLVVVRDDVGLSTAVQQQLTREVRQFETVFISGVDLLGRTARLRIFTEDEELGFAGHPVLGVGAVLHSELSAAAAEETWALELSSRIVSVLTRGRDGWIEASMDQGPARFGMNVTGELTDRYRRALGLPLAAVRADLPMQVVSTGLPYLIVPVHAQGLATAHIATPDFEAILAASGAKFVYVLDPATPEGRTWDNTGRIEDVATGSAAGPAAAYLIEHRVHPAGVPLRLAQGRFMGRPSTIEVRREPGDGHYWVGGPVAPVASGRFHARLAD
jgi:trans-2,3-dihydro-3-hydroxyanthranilate isomerase